MSQQSASGPVVPATSNKVVLEQKERPTQPYSLLSVFDFQSYDWHFINTHFPNHQLFIHRRPEPQHPQRPNWASVRMLNQPKLTINRFCRSGFNRIRVANPV
jgi:hypothetical protein